MMTDLRLAQLADATYTTDPTWTGEGLDQSIHACRADEDGLTVIAFRGSIAPHDWFLDFAALPLRATINHQAIGDVHAGFLDAAECVLDPIQAAIAGHPYALAGHSLGGAIALVVGALLTAAGSPPSRILTLGAPKVGYASVAKVLSAVPIAQYRRGNDPVPEVPLALPSFPWLHMRSPLIAVGVPQDDPFACHHCPGYVDDVAAFFAAQQAAA